MDYGSWIEDFTSRAQAAGLDMSGRGRFTRSMAEAVIRRPHTPESNAEALSEGEPSLADREEMVAWQRQRDAVDFLCAELEALEPLASMEYGLWYIIREPEGKTGWMVWGYSETTATVHTNALSVALAVREENPAADEIEASAREFDNVE